MVTIKIMDITNLVIMLLFAVLYFYQIVYMIIGLLRRRAVQEPEPKRLCRFAALISARNEAPVIAELIQSLREQNYPNRLLDIYVLADNCTDDTAAIAAAAGAKVFERFDRTHVGKGYALDALLGKIRAQDPAPEYDGFFIFDADNIVHPDFVREMNKTFLRGDYDALTSYRNAKNYSDNWITTSYAIQFLREARFLNHPRELIRSGCAVSGTGFLVSARLIDALGGWPFHLLTEDIEFTVYCAIHGLRIGYCDRAMIYDEQPTSFLQSMIQRTRWSRGFFQICRKYLWQLVKSFFSKKTKKFTVYDMLMIVLPCLTTVGSLILWIVTFLFGLVASPDVVPFICQTLSGLALTLVEFYLGMMIYGALTIICEWDRVALRPWDKLKYLWGYPIFIATYALSVFTALWGGSEWKHIEHHPTGELRASIHKKKDTALPVG